MRCKININAFEQDTIKPETVKLYARIKAFLLGRFSDAKKALFPEKLCYGILDFDLIIGQNT